MTGKNEKFVAEWSEVAIWKQLISSKMVLQKIYELFSWHRCGIWIVIFFHVMICNRQLSHASNHFVLVTPHTRNILLFQMIHGKYIWYSAYSLFVLVCFLRYNWHDKWQANQSDSHKHTMLCHTVTMALIVLVLCISFSQQELFPFIPFPHATLVGNATHQQLLANYTNWAFPRPNNYTFYKRCYGTHTDAWNDAIIHAKVKFKTTCYKNNIVWSQGPIADCVQTNTRAALVWWFFLQRVRYNFFHNQL